MTRRRGSLTGRLALLCVAIAALTGVLASVLAIGLIRSADDRAARRTLSRLADAAQTTIDRSSAGLLAQARTRRVLTVLGVRYGLIRPADGVGPNGHARRVISTYPLMRAAITDRDIAAVRAGRAVSASRTVRGRHVYLEARPTLGGGGGIVLIQPGSDATAGGDAAVRRVLLATVIGAGVAALGGFLLARRLARPLRRTASAAHALAQGRRDIAVPVEGPAEVADVAGAVNSLAGALALSEARQREFLMSVSHDLRTPLTAISGYAESLADGVVPAERIAEVGGVLVGEAKRLDRLVGDLLDLARLNAEDFRIEPGQVDLAEMARSAAMVWDARCAAVDVEFRLEATAAHAYTDAARVRQIADGLLENALRVTPRGAPIVLSVSTDLGGHARVEVRDGGPGLSEDDLAVAFRRGELFRRYRGIRQVGTGLGLAIVQGLVERLNATIEAGHATEGGARFTVRLPTSFPSADGTSFPSADGTTFPSADGTTSPPPDGTTSPPPDGAAPSASSGAGVTAS